MSKGNMLQGQATGKVGDIVFMVRNGQQISRVYTSAGGRSGDQASIAVRRQRVRFGAASNQYLFYRNIVRGMYRTGKATRQSDYNYFVKENVDLLPYLTKEENAAGVKCAMPGTFSRGTLGNILYDLKTYYDAQAGANYEIRAVGGSLGYPIEWSDTVEDAKAALKAIFPNARKVAFMIGWLNPREVELPTGTQWTHDLIRYDVVFDLYEEDAEILDSATVKQYFKHYVTSEAAQQILEAQAGYFVSGESYFLLQDDSEEMLQYFNRLYVQVYATNDQVGDCYTTTCASFIVPAIEGALDLYNTLRTDNHRQVAEDSYGYATGVMRTNIQQA